MIEVAVLFDTYGAPILWHLPPGRTQTSIPDSAALWMTIWDNRAIVGGLAHTHPWNGPAVPSYTDIRTFGAIEKALGKRLVWPIVTLSDVAHYIHHNDQYIEIPAIPMLQRPIVDMLRAYSETGVNND